MSNVRTYQFTDEQVSKILDHCDSMIEMCDTKEEAKIYEDIEAIILSAFPEDSYSVEHDSEI